jgi:hypothetical protein
VRPTGPGSGLARIAGFLNKSFTSNGIAASKLRARSEKFLLVRATLFFFSAAIPPPSLAQPQPTVAFQFFKEAHQYPSVRPPGDDVTSVSAGASRAVTVEQIGALRSQKLGALQDPESRLSHARK